MRADRIVELLLAAIAGLVSALAFAAATTWSPTAVVAAGLVVGALAGVVGRAVSIGRVALPGRVAVGVVVGVVLGELAAVVVFSGSIDAQLERQASPGTELAAASLEQARAARAGLDDAVTRADARRDEALVVARCEVNPSADCPTIRITGIPGAGPEARTANDFLGDAQRALDTAIAERDRRAPVLDAEVVVREQALARARDAALAGGLGARWQAMNAYTLDNPGSLILRLLVSGFFVLLTLLPLLMKRWRGASSQEAESSADTAIAVTRAQVRAQVDQLWAEQELNSARMAVEAQNAIDAERQRRRVAEALAADQVGSEALAADQVGSEALAADQVGSEALAVASSRELEPGRELESAGELEPPRGGGVPNLPDVTRAAVRFIRPFVPPVVSGALGGVGRLAPKPIRQVFEETEEFHFTLRRTHRVTVESEGGDRPDQVTADREWVDVSGPRIEERRGVVLEGSDGYRGIGGGAARGRGEDTARQLPPA